MCPGLLIEKHIISSTDLKNHLEQPFCYEPQTVTTSMLEAESTVDVTLLNTNLGKYETVVELIMFGMSIQKD